MQNNWRKVSLGDLQKEGLAHIQTGPFGTVLKASEYSDQGVPVISVGEIREGYLKIHDHTPKVSEDTVNRLPQFVLEAGDIVFGRKGAINRNSIVNAEQSGWFLGSDGIRLRMSPEINSVFVSYTFRSPAVGRWLLQNSSGSIMPSLNQKTLDRLPVWLPEREVQDAIASLLSSIDQKIELNNRINAELEAMAKTLYDYWFVQFDFPDANGKPYKTSGGKMVYNQPLKREIPEGWESTPLSKITPVSNHSVNPADYSSKVFRHFSIPVYDSTKTFGLEAGETIGSNKFTVTENDILVSKLNPWFSRVIYAMDEDDLICSTEFVVWRTPSNSIQNFLYMVATSPQFVAHCTQSATGTSNSHKRVNPGVMMRYEVAFKEEVASALGKKLEPMIKKMVINQRENTELSKLRDWLLPMLMNGQVTVE